MPHSSYVRYSRHHRRATSYQRHHTTSPRWAVAATAGGGSSSGRRPPMNDAQTMSPEPNERTYSAALPSTARLATALASSSNDDGPLRRRSGSGTFARHSTTWTTTTTTTAGPSRLSLSVTRSRSPTRDGKRDTSSGRSRTRSYTMPSTLSSPPLPTSTNRDTQADPLISPGSFPNPRTSHNLTESRQTGNRSGAAVTDADADADADDTEPPMSHDTSDLSSDHADIFDRYSSTSSDDLADIVRGTGAEYDSDAALSTADSLSSDEIIDMPLYGGSSYRASPYGSLGGGGRGSASSTPFSRWRDRVLSAPDMIQSQSHLPILGGDHRRLGGSAYSYSNAIESGGATTGLYASGQTTSSTVDRREWHERREVKRAARRAQAGASRGLGVRSHGTTTGISHSLIRASSASLGDPGRQVEEV